MRGTKPKNVRENNLKLLIDLYRNHQSLSISQIAKIAHLSRTTVVKINEFLLEANLILPLGKGSSTDEGGKKPKIYTFNARYGYVLCFHIRYETISARLFDMSLETIHKEEIPIQKNAPLDEIIPLIGNSYKEFCALKGAKKPLAIMIAVHGTVDREQGICFHSTYFPSWKTNAPLKALISGEIGDDVPVHVDNWINYKVYAEKETGIARDLSSFVLINAGYHGVTSGVFFGQKPYIGEHFLAGEVGHIIVNPQADYLCQCGGRGCLESMLDHKHLVKTALNRKDHFPESVLFKNEKSPTLDTIIDGFLENDPLCEELIDEVIHWLALGLSSVSLLIDPQAIIIEGEYARGGEKFREKLMSKLSTISMVRLKNRSPVLLNQAQGKAALVGAATYAIKNCLKDARNAL